MRDERGRFLPGPDDQRHELTQEERRKGYRTATERAAEHGWGRYAWLYYKVRSYYRSDWDGNTTTPKKGRKRA